MPVVEVESSGWHCVSATKMQKQKQYMHLEIKNFMDPLDLLTKLEGRAQWPKIADS